jgi:DNA-binding PadR family transcriptional regulator
MTPPQLRPPVLHILLSLVKRDLHGLGIAEEVERITAGATELGPGTLYRTLREMVEEGLIDPVSAPDAQSDPRRKYYRITSMGQASLTAEAERLDRIVRVARDLDLIPGST